MHTAILDLGTNTFNLLVFCEQDGIAKILHRSKYYVQLGLRGINSRTIAPDAFQRGIEAIGKHSLVMQQMGVEKIFAFGTAAIRSAENGNEFVAEVFKRYKIEVAVIDGDMEAMYIYWGVKKAVPLSEKPVVILDIGGGSNELIICNNEQVFWKKSYPLGMARLIEMFQPSDPVTQQQIAFMDKYCTEQMVDFFIQTSQYNIDTLIGASGPFDTFAEIIALQNTDTTTLQSQTWYSLGLESYYSLAACLVQNDAACRAAIPGMDAMRVDMIVMAALFTNFIAKNIGVKNIIQSDFSLKEGVISYLTQHKLTINR